MAMQVNQKPYFMSPSCLIDGIMGSLNLWENLEIIGVKISI